jgi:nickel superoxide dismutase
MRDRAERRASGAGTGVVSSHHQRSAGRIDADNPLHQESLRTARIRHRDHVTDPRLSCRNDQKPVTGQQAWSHAQSVNDNPPRSEEERRHRHANDQGQDERREWRPRRQRSSNVGRATNVAHMRIVSSLLSGLLSRLDRVSAPGVAEAHCDLPCGVYDPAQARIEAEAVKSITERYNASDDELFRTRALFIREQRAELLKHHLWVLWTDYFTPDHLEAYPNLHDVFWRATKKAGEAKKTSDVAVAEELLNQVAEIEKIFWATKNA